MSIPGFLVVKNFERFQHYKDRSPPWIKLHADLLHDYAFGRLHDASKMHLMGIWILASKSDNLVPDDAEWIARRIGANSKVNIEALVQAGFITRLLDDTQDDSTALADCEQSARLEEERREEESVVPKKRASKKISPDEQAVVDHYRTVHPKRLRGDPSPKLAGLIRKALASYPLADLCRAIDGNAASTFHRENNHLGLDLILRDASKIDYFLGLAGQVRIEERTNEFGAMVPGRVNAAGEWEPVSA